MKRIRERKTERKKERKKERHEKDIFKKSFIIIPHQQFHLQETGVQHSIAITRTHPPLSGSRLMWGV